jgi:hypothetical protein
MLCVDKRAVALRRELSKQAQRQERTYRRDEKWAGRAGPPDVADVQACVNEPARVREPAEVCEPARAREPAEDSAAEWDVVGLDDIDCAADRARPCIGRCNVS